MGRGGMGESCLLVLREHLFFAKYGGCACGHRFEEVRKENQ
uniref:Uncharacterized protein n=1 Tax=Anguilla anguilla TaxID=7936 RepID=A0A0E9T9S0_ANGAN